MYGDIAIERLDFLLHFVISKKQLLSLLTLVLQFSRQLVILQNCQTSCGLELLVIERQ